MAVVTMPKKENVTPDNVLITNQFKGGSKIVDKKHVFEHCLLTDPRGDLAEGLIGFEVVTARDGGRRIAWSRLNLQQIQEAKEKFEQMVADGLVPYYIDPKTGQTSEIPMSDFDPAEGAVMFEKPDFDPSNILVAPTRAVAGG